MINIWLNINRTRITNTLIPREKIKSRKGLFFMFTKNFYSSLEEFANLYDNREIRDDLLNLFNMAYVDRVTGKEMERTYEEMLVGDTGNTYDKNSYYHIYRVTEKIYNDRKY